VVAVEANFADALNIARAFALLPQPAARTRPVMREARRRGARKRLAVHPCQRQHGAAFFLGDGRHQAIGIPEYGIEPVAHLCLSISSTTRSPTDIRTTFAGIVCTILHHKGP